MECERCGQVSDWIGDESSWDRVTEGQTAALELYRCEECGHEQLVR